MFTLHLHPSKIALTPLVALAVVSIHKGDAFLKKVLSGHEGGIGVFCLEVLTVFWCASSGT
jgi:hypothetical protein